MTQLRMTAITKHPKGTASFHFRVVTAHGSKWESALEKPLPLTEAIKETEEQLKYLRILAGETGEPR